jgi:23S rRNA (cytidine1920-2'-O)/16S rRNA (cytidine1409-2'-O)-methyltransferase
MANRRRLDVELVRRELAPSREAARRLVEAGAVLVSGSVATKAARLVDAGEPVVVTTPPRFVGRGGEKLDAALERFGLDVGGRRALDAGSSTGGFTDCLLQRGAASVAAVDVGRHQLHERLRADPRVDVHEQTDLRAFDVAAAGGPFDVVVADLSFISIGAVARHLVAACTPDGDLVVLVKPQFEAGRAEVSRGRGVIRDPEVWRATVAGALSALVDAGATIMGAMASPLRGADGNVEFLVHATPAPRPGHPIDLEALVAEASPAPERS